MTLPAYADPEVRRTGIGGSDAAAACGLSPWAGPFDVYLEKVGQAAGLVETEAMRWGTILEEPIAREVGRQRDWRIRRDRRTLRHPVYPWMFTHLDRWAIDREGQRRVLEVKNASHYRAKDFGEPGSDQVPPEYAIQVQHELAVTGGEVATLAALIGGNHLGVYEIPRDEAAIADIIELEADLWAHVERREPPDYDGSAGAGRYLADLYPVANGEKRASWPEIEDLADQYRTVLAIRDDAERQKEVLRQEMTAAMGELYQVDGPDFRITLSNVKGATRVEWKALAATFNPPPDLIAEFTTVADDPDRRLTFTDRS